MNRIQHNDLYLWQFDNLTDQPSIKHFVTDRYSTVGREFTLSYSSSPNRQEIVNNRSMLAKAFDIEPTRLFFPYQVHKTNVVVVTHDTKGEELFDSDALITNENGIGIAAMSADCVTILLYDVRNKAIGAVHAGWRGTVARILEKTLGEMQNNFGTQGKDIVACIGPSICQDSYEVGEEVIQEVDKAFGKENGLMITQPNKKAKLDLWKANAMQLTGFGVSHTNIEIANLCTVKNNSHFFSARKGDSGRFAAGIMMI